ncbi:MAG: DPP IV N-terminal domain-containing protein [Tepidisphaeraceae bacterium]
MRVVCRGLLILCLAGVSAIGQEVYKPSPTELREAYERASEMRTIGNGRVFLASVEANWAADGAKFWYRNDLAEGKREFVLVDAAGGKRGPAFDHAKLAAALGKASGKKIDAERLPFDRISLIGGGQAVALETGGKKWKVALDTYECKAYDGTIAGPESRPADRRRGRADDRRAVGPRDGDVASPDGKWIAFVKEFNLYLRPKSGGEAVKLSTAGVSGNAFGGIIWSPDSKTIVAHRIELGDRKEVYLIESSPRGGGPARLQSHVYPRPGDKFNVWEMWLFDAESHKATRADTDRIDFGESPAVHWRDGGKRFTFERTDRGHQRFRIIEVDAATGKTRNLVDEKTNTFICGLKHFTYYMENGREIIRATEKDGWNHLYLVDGETGQEKNCITPGEWPVLGVERVDEQKRQIWFRAGGVWPEQDPYHVHFCRVNFDGTGFVRLTAGDGTHRIRYSPDGKYFIDSYSRVDLPPVSELRKSEDGALVCVLEKADVSLLLATGWKYPERFTAKGRDGKTDIYGMVIRPRNFDPRKKYPVIEYIYAGPQDSFVTKYFHPFNRDMHELAELGFIVVQCDGMGTSNRSKAFHDVCWKNLGDAGLPDRIAWITALAARDASLDISRVGIFGTSAGGQSSTGAVLFHGEFYKAAASSCGCHDNWLDKAWWNEQWMGYPVGPHYAAQSNITNAAKLKGNLLLIVGELDHNVPPESTFRLADALIKANKNFELVVLPGSDHTDGGPFGRHKRQDFFVRSLLGVEAPGGT